MNSKVRNVLAQAEVKNILKLIEYEALLLAITLCRGNV